MDAFFASVEVAKNPKLKGKPVIVGGSAENRGVVSAASYEARKFGVHSAMPMAKAIKLCPHAVFITSNFADYSAFSERIHKLFYEVTPLVQPLSLDEAFLDITGSINLFSDDIVIAENLKNRIKKYTSLVASIGIASNKLVAKFASIIAKPNGIAKILPGYEKSFLAPFPVSRLWGVGEKTAKQLDIIGLKTIQDIVDMGLEDLIKTIGKNLGESLYNYSLGIDNSPVETEGTRKSISKETTFAKDIYDVNELRLKLSFLVEKVAFYLREKRLKASTITLKLRFSDFKLKTTSRTLNFATDRDDIIFKTVVELLKKNKIDKKVRLIGVALSNLTEHNQLDLFESVPIDKKSSLYRSIDKIRNKFGFELIMTGNRLLSKKKETNK
jgi:DNA polymerase IV